MTTETLTRTALEIGYSIADAATWHGDHCRWSQPDHGEIPDGDLYEGAAGAAWFLARLATATNDSKIENTARAAARYSLAWAQLELSSATAAGFYSGPLGVLWSAADVAHGLGDEDLQEQCRVQVHTVLDSHDVTWPASDVVNGGAGSLLALVGLSRRCPSMRDTAVRLGDEISSQAEASIARLSLGGSNNSAPALGLAHGLSGLAWSLLELYRMSRDSALLDRALQCIDWSRAWFDRRLCTWRDPVSRSPLSLSWCNGITGITLARLRALEITDDAQLRAEVGAALAKVRAAAADALDGQRNLTWEQSNYSICHGLMGIADLLLYASQVLDVAEHEVVGRQLVEHGCRMANATGAWPYGTVGGVSSYGLMLGLAGIGAVILRFADPTGLPPIGLPAYSTSE